MIEIIQNADKFKWAGIPFEHRYSQSASAPKWLLKEMWEIDDLLDLKFYLPTEKWHVVRYPNGRLAGGFVKVWECKEDPERGLHEGLGAWIIGALHAGDTRKKSIQERIKEVDEQNKAIEDAAKREMEAQAKDTAKDLCKVLRDWHDNGPDGETHLVYPSAEIKKEDTCTSTK